MTRTDLRRAAWLGAPLLLLLGCSGTIVPGKPKPTPWPPSGWAPPALTGDDFSTNTGLRRLSSFELERTVQQVFGVTGSTASLPRARAFDGFFSNNMHGDQVSLGETEQLLSFAETVAVGAVPLLVAPAGCERSALGAACRSTLLATLGRAAWRRPPTDAELASLASAYDAAVSSGLSQDEGLEAIIAALVMSPAFLYRTETTLDGWELASRLSYAVWGSAPDEQLLTAAQQGKLATADGRAQQLERLLAGRSGPVSARAEAEAGFATIGFAEQTWWNLWGNGTLTLELQLAAPVEQVAVRVWQQKGGPDDAQMALRVDGQALGQFAVSALADAPMVITAAVALPAGTHTVEVEFLNNYIVGTDDRNLFVDWAELRGHGMEDVATVGLAHFVAEWLNASEMNLATKDQSWLVGTPSTLQGDLEAEFEHMVGAVIVAKDGRFEDLLGGSFTYANASLASFYGLPGTFAADWVKAALDPAERRGVITQGYVMAANTKESGEYSVIQLGKFVIQRLLCGNVPPPPANLDTSFSTANYPPEWTHRQMFTARTETQQPCQTCHAFLNPPGFAFYKLDAIGRGRSKDDLGKPFDTTGTLTNLDGKPASFTGVGDMLGQISQSRMARTCFVRSFLAYASGRSLTASDAAEDQQLNAQFEGSRSFRQLLAAWVRSDAFLQPGPRQEQP